MEDTKIEITKDIVSKVKKEAVKLIELTGLKIEMEIEQDKDNDAILINLSSTDSAGLLIGRRGETVSAIQYILGMIMRQKLGGWVRIIVNVGDWRQKQEEQLTELAQGAAVRARETKEDQLLYNLNPSQRRVIHLALSHEKDITTQSQGEGRERHLIISTKK